MITRDDINDGSSLICFLAYCNDIVVGAVCCRIDQSENRRRLYIMTLGVLAKYRELGLGNLFNLIRMIFLYNEFSLQSIGTLMLEHVFKVCEHEGNIDSIYLSVTLEKANRMKTIFNLFS